MPASGARAEGHVGTPRSEAGAMRRTSSRGAAQATFGGHTAARAHFKGGIEDSTRQVRTRLSHVHTRGTWTTGRRPCSIALARAHVARTDQQRPILKGVYEISPFP